MFTKFTLLHTSTRASIPLKMLYKKPIQTYPKNCVLEKNWYEPTGNTYAYVEPNASVKSRVFNLVLKESTETADLISKGSSFHRFGKNTEGRLLLNFELALTLDSFGYCSLNSSGTAVALVKRKESISPHTGTFSVRYSGAVRWTIL